MTLKLKLLQYLQNFSQVIQVQLLYDVSRSATQKLQSLPLLLALLTKIPKQLFVFFFFALSIFPRIQNPHPLPKL